jgi:hypothetical protein
MQFLMTDGTYRTITEVVSAEVEHGRLVCRNRWGVVVTSFGRDEVVAFGETLDFKDRREEPRTPDE